MTGNGRDSAGPSRSAHDTRAGPGTARYSSPMTGSSGREPKSSEWSYVCAFIGRDRKRLEGRSSE